MRRKEDEAIRDAWDDPGAVGRYVNIQRSRADNLEWPAIEALLPKMSGTEVLDLGAGPGDFAAWAASAGVRLVTAVDRSPAMQQYAVPHSAVRWLNRDIESLELDSERFDCIVSLRTLHYIRSYPDLAQRLYRWLAPNGALILSVEHPIMSANTQDGWLTREAASVDRAWPIDDYLSVGSRVRRQRDGLGVTIWHRPVSAYIMPLIESGFTIRALLEPQYNVTGQREQPAAAEDNRRRPNLLVVRADKLS